jgi:hypothetical protein
VKRKAPGRQTLLHPLAKEPRNRERLCACIELNDLKSRKSRSQFDVGNVVLLGKGAWPAVAT